ncbi:hypothetical protein Pen01_03850 [Phytomonospora endophytica]|nr:hypothetical protein Pen01_03850 [Phytomonospora endophytica]
MLEYWRAVRDMEYVVPTDRPLDELIEELTGALTSPQAELRDELAYSTLVTWVLNGTLDDRLTDLATRMTKLLEHEAVQARTFATLILAAVVERDSAADLCDVADVRDWRDAFVTWYTGERDLRGWDPKLGWLHAVAHGADTLGAFGCSPRLSAEEAAELLAVAAVRLVTPNDYLFAQQEDDRLALAVALILCRRDLGEEQSVAWLSVIDGYFATGEPGPVPVPASNTMRTLHSLYLHADLGVHYENLTRDLAHSEAVRKAIASLLGKVWPSLPTG